MSMNHPWGNMNNIKKCFLSITLLLTCSLLFGIHIGIEWGPEGIDDPNLKSVLIETKIKENKDGIIDFTILISENPEFKDGYIHALSKFSFGQLEIFDGKKKLADIDLNGYINLDKKKEFRFKIHKDLLDNSTFTFRTYPVDPGEKDPHPPLSGINFELNLIKFYKSYLCKISNNTDTSNSSSPDR